MAISGGGDFVFLGLCYFSEVTGALIGLRDDAPEEVKKSWEEYLDFMK